MYRLDVYDSDAPCVCGGRVHQDHAPAPVLTWDKQPVVSRSYDLAQLANLNKGVSIRLGSIAARKSAQRKYAAAVKDMLRAIRTAIASDVITGYQNRNALVSDAMTTDALADWFAIFNGMRDRLLQTAIGRVRTVITGESQQHTRRWNAIVQSQINVNLENVVRQEALNNYLDAVALRTAGLITGIYDDTVRQVATLTQQAVLNNLSVNDLRKQIQARLGISSRRANNIARDQVATLTSELNHIRQEQAGVLKYEWSTSGDSRVRDLHEDFNGKTYTWAKPPRDGHPGTAINCRCVAIGILEV